MTPAPATPAGEHPRVSAPAPARPHSLAAPAHAAPAARGAGSPRWLVAGLVVLAVVLVAWWFGAPGRAAPPAAIGLAASTAAAERAEGTAEPVRTSAVTVTASLAAGAAPAVPVPTPTTTPPRATEPEPERPAAERRAQAERDRITRERPRAARVAEPPRAEPGGRRVEPAAPPAAVAAAPAAAQAPEPAHSVEQACAGSGNFLSRDFCRVRACRNPAAAGDPICVRFREMEDANRNRQNQ